MKKRFLKFIEEEKKIATTGELNDHLTILHHFISLMTEEHVKNSFTYYFINMSHDIESGFKDFHKSLRQTDFYEIGEGHLDMIFYYFIRISEVPFKTIKLFIEKINQNGSEDELF